MRDGGKGDTPRPLGVPLEDFDSNWDAIFKRTRKDVVEELLNGLTEEETNETASVKGLSK